MTNQNEKKEENKSSIIEIFKAARDETTGLKQLMIDIDNDFNKSAVELNKAKGRDLERVYSYRNNLLLKWLLYNEIVESRKRDYLLALMLEELTAKIESKPESVTIKNELEEALGKLDEKFAKRLSQLFSPAGHEAMYGAT